MNWVITFQYNGRKTADEQTDGQTDTIPMCPPKFIGGDN